ncbi:MAG: NADH-quinone oxidoreductase subunit NuoK [Deltaproteobacteria bacterium]|nr:MAG: NADH-quinone oxidoreductase subunit NuoK [Deltaproteobacteria bacterium]
MIGLNHYLVLSGLLFVLGAVGVLVRRNALVILMSIELMLNAANLALIAFSRQLGDEAGHALAVFVMTVAAAEAAVGLGLVLNIFRHTGTVNVDRMRSLRG